MHRSSSVLSSSEVEDCSSTVCYGVDPPVLGSFTVMAILMHVLICMDRLPVHSNGQCAVRFWSDYHIQE